MIAPDMQGMVERHPARLHGPEQVSVQALAKRFAFQEHPGAHPVGGLGPQAVPQRRECKTARLDLGQHADAEPGWVEQQQPAEPRLEILPHCLSSPISFPCALVGRR